MKKLLLIILTVLLLIGTLFFVKTGNSNKTKTDVLVVLIISSFLPGLLE